MTPRRPPLVRPPPKTAPEHERACWWRVHRMGLTRAALAKRIGLSVSEIANYEAGIMRQSGRAPDYKRYRLLCAAVDAGVDGFDWS